MLRDNFMTKRASYKRAMHHSVVWFFSTDALNFAIVYSVFNKSASLPKPKREETEALLQRHATCSYSARFAFKGTAIVRYACLYIYLTEYILQKCVYSMEETRAAGKVWQQVEGCLQQQTGRKKKGREREISV